MPGIIDLPNDIVENCSTPAFTTTAAEYPIYRAQANGVIVAAV